MEKKNVLLTILISLFLLQLSWAQSWEFGLSGMHLRTGGMAKNYDFLSEQEFTSVDAKMTTFGTTVGLNLPIANFSNNVSLTAQGNIHATYSMIVVSTEISNAPTAGAHFALPGYLVMRYGAGSNVRSTAKFGVGVGIGAQVHALFTNAVNNYPEDDGRYAYATPGFMIEFVAESLGDLFFLQHMKLRFESQFKKFKHSNNLGPYSFGYTFHSMGASLVYYINFD